MYMQQAFKLAQDKTLPKLTRLSKVIWSLFLPCSLQLLIYCFCLLSKIKNGVVNASLNMSVSADFKCLPPRGLMILQRLTQVRVPSQPATGLSSRPKRTCLFDAVQSQRIITTQSSTYGRRPPDQRECNRGRPCQEYVKHPGANPE
ncbi:hypothetical protein BDR04DRAFT_749460 [Suillus decipiens]|nr:hypothetical protein BDR04DRAFT_749460 [Suillus decipiens]